MLVLLEVEMQFNLRVVDGDFGNLLDPLNLAIVEV
jgi:hypothetical protein